MADLAVAHQAIQTALHEGLCAPGGMWEDFAQAADHVIDALAAAGYEITPVPVSAEDRLLADVKAMVKDSGLKQLHIAAKLGITPKHLSQLLTGKAALSVHWTEQIAQVCGRTLDIRLTGEEAVDERG